MSHTTPNKSSLHKRFLQATKLWLNPDYRPEVEAFSDLWFGSNCALLQHTAETAGDFDDETQRCLNNLLALKPHQHAEAAKKWLQRANGLGPDGNVPSADVTALANSVVAIVHGIAAVYRWRESRWGNDTNATASIREHVKTCWRSYATALPVDGPLELHECNPYLTATKLSVLMALLNEPTTATHWLMLQRLFVYLLQNALDDQHTRTRSASEATEPIGTEKASLARRVRMPATAEHEVRTHLVAVALHGETRPLTVSRVAEGPSGWYLDPVALGATRIAPEILKQLDLSWRVVRHEQTQPLRIAIPSDGLPSLTGPSAGGLLLLSMHAAATSGFMREDSTASFDIQPAREFQEKERMRLSDITAISVAANSVWKKAASLVEVPPTNRIVLAHDQTCIDHAGHPLDWNTWAAEAQKQLRVECVAAQTAQDAWQNISGGPQIKAANKYFDELIEYADRVPVYFPPKTELPNVRVQVRVRMEVFWDDLRARSDEHDRLNGVDSHKAYSHRLSDDEDPRRKESQTIEVVLDWDTQVRPTLRRGVLLGDPGMGKSWLLKHEARTLAQTAKGQLESTGRIHSLVWPILLPLSDIAGVLKDRRANAARDLWSVLREILHAKKVSEFVLEQIAAAWGTDRCVLLLDAWDEVPDAQQETLRECLEHWARDSRHAQARVLITSRVVGRPNPFWPMPKDSETDRELEFQPFAPVQTREFIERFFSATPHIGSTLIAALLGAPQLNGLAQIPLLLSFLCRYAYKQLESLRAVAAYAPTLDLQSLCRNDLYADVVKWFLNRDWHSDSRALSDAERMRRLEVLAHVAFQLLRKGHQKFPLSVFDEALAAALHHTARGFTVTKSEFDELRQSLIGRDGLVIPTGVGEQSSYLFLHLTIQEYLAALSLKSRPWPEVETILARNWDHPDYAEIWKLYALETRDEDGSLDRMLTTVFANPDNLDTHLLRHYSTALKWGCLCDWPKQPQSHAWHQVIEWTLNAINSVIPAWPLLAVARTISDPTVYLPSVILVPLLDRLDPLWNGCSPDLFACVRSRIAKSLIHHAHVQGDCAMLGNLR